MRREFRGDPGWSNDWWGRDPIEEIEPEEEEEMEETTIITQDEHKTLWRDTATRILETRENILWFMNTGRLKILSDILVWAANELDSRDEQPRS